MSIRALIYASLCLLALASPATAENNPVKACFNLNSNAEQRDCLHQLYRDVSVQLEAAFTRKVEQTLYANYPGSSEAYNGKRAQAIRDSQTAWLAYREAECGGVIGGDRGGTGTHGWMWACFAEKTLLRIHELNTVYAQRGPATLP